MDDAARKLKVADHMLTMTYPLVKDPKLLLAVLENTFSSMEAAMTGFLERERARKQIQPYPNTFEAKFTVLRSIAGRHSIPKEALRAMHEMKETLQERRQSPVEFRRGSKFVICGEGYKMRTLTPEDLKRHLNVAKGFYQLMQRNAEEIR